MEPKHMSKLHKTMLIAIIALATAGLMVVVFWSQIVGYILRPTDSSLPAGISSVSSDEIRTVVENMNTPWAIAFLPSGDLLVTERRGQVQRIGENGQVYPIAGVRETSEGGLLGIALHPNFADNRYVYLYSTTNTNDTLTNRVQRYILTDDRLVGSTKILTGIPASANHDGGALAFGPDDKLYITTGDAGNADNAQNRQSLAGKILRIDDDGSVPSDNPFGNEIWSYGHRNPQGLAWDSQNRLWATEHGPSGAQSGYDELNLIQKGANYGWPVITGDQTRDGMQTPIAQSGSSETWAPAGLAYADGSLYFTGLRGQTLYQAKINDDTTVSLTRHFSDQYGRLRAVATHGDALYFSTSNRDGRGAPTSSDDRIFALPLHLFNN